MVRHRVIFRYVNEAESLEHFYSDDTAGDSDDMADWDYEFVHQVNLDLLKFPLFVLLVTI